MVWCASLETFGVFVELYAMNLIPHGNDLGNG